MKKNDVVTIIPTGEIGIVYQTSSKTKAIPPDEVDVTLDCSELCSCGDGYDMEFGECIKKNKLIYIGKL